MKKVFRLRRVKRQRSQERMMDTGIATTGMKAIPFLALSLLFPTIRGYIPHFSVSPKLKRSLASYRSEFYASFSLDVDGVQFTEEEKDLGNAARLAAWKAGKAMINGLGALDQDEDIMSKIGSRDIVTKVDKESQEIIKETILSFFPHHKFLGEEDVEPGIEASTAITEIYKNEPHLWICDPVDGTTNYAHGMPLAVVIIAYASHGVVKHGFIFDPFRNESYYAWEGKGAYLNGRRIKCDQIQDLDRSLICTGSPPNFKALDACLRGINHLSSKVQSMRVLGSAAFMLSYISNGRTTAYFEPDLNCWDAAAGSLIIREAGGKVTDVWGNDYQLTTRNIVASNGLIHERLLQELQEARVWLE